MGEITQHPGDFWKEWIERNSATELTLKTDLMLTGTCAWRIDSFGNVERIDPMELTAHPAGEARLEKEE